MHTALGAIELGEGTENSIDKHSVAPQCPAWLKLQITASCQDVGLEEGSGRMSRGGTPVLFMEA